MEVGKVRTREQIISCFKDGQTIAIGGQAGSYMPWELIDMIVESNARHLTTISIDACDPGFGIDKLIENGQIDKMITTHVGVNPNASKKMMEGKIEVEFCPMGTFMERVRCGGGGLGGFLTKTGLGTVVEKGKQIVEIRGEKYLLEEPLRADIAVTRARYADPMGNLAYHGTGTASHPIIATCADLSIVQCDLYCDTNELDMDRIRVPGMFVDMIYIGEGPLNQLLGPIRKNDILRKEMRANVR